MAQHPVYVLFRALDAPSCWPHLQGERPAARTSVWVHSALALPDSLAHCSVHRWPKRVAAPHGAALPARM
eukprot:10254028-Alexandrium_andersonii.AAC.1